MQDIWHGLRDLLIAWLIGRALPIGRCCMAYRYIYLAHFYAVHLRGSLQHGTLAHHRLLLAASIISPTSPDHLAKSHQIA